ncbi:MAG: T9SS type A sorting domain-containing protein, partial [Saprospiraceae bacterium]|nr:T9SS type A sorting domain-containing protein [Saprospiraceae bacterium]
VQALNGIDGGDRTNWNTPVALNPRNPASLYYGSHRLYKSTNRADLWQPISADLTNLDPDYLGGTFSGTISTITVAPSDTNVIYVGTDDGMVQVSFNDGADWAVISDELPLSYVTRVAVDPYDALSVYVTLSGYRQVSYLPHVFHSPDGGQTWYDISGDLPEVPVNDIIIDPDLDLTLYVATDMGVWYTADGGLAWDILGAGLPMTVCNDLTFDPETRKLVVATFGRSMYSYDLSEPTSISGRPVPDLQLVTYPNPASTEGYIRLYLPRAMPTRIDLISLDGKLVRALLEERLSEGTHVVPWERQAEPAGLYVIRVTAGESYSSRAVMLD